MTKLIKILIVISLLTLTGCEEKPIGVVTQDSKHIALKDMDPRLKAYPEAVEWYKDSKIYPEAAFNLGYIYTEKIEDYKESIIWYKRAYKLGSIDAANNIASSYSNMNKYDSSIAWYLLAISNNVQKSHYNLGYLYHDKLKDYSKAIKYYKIAIERESSLINSLKNIAWIYHENLKDDIKASAYIINLIAQGKTKEKTISFLKTKWKLSDETIKKGYELQLTMPGLPRRYTGGI
jgi:TPR repeat protein